MTVLTGYLTLDALYLLVFVLYLWYMVAVSLYIYEPRDITEVGGTSKILCCAGYVRVECVIRLLEVVVHPLPNLCLLYLTHTDITDLPTYLPLP